MAVFNPVFNAIKSMVANPIPPAFRRRNRGGRASGTYTPPTPAVGGPVFNDRVFPARVFPNRVFN